MEGIFAVWSRGSFESLSESWMTSATRFAKRNHSTEFPVFFLFFRFSVAANRSLLPATPLTTPVPGFWQRSLLRSPIGLTVVDPHLQTLFLYKFIFSFSKKQIDEKIPCRTLLLLLNMHPEYPEKSPSTGSHQRDGFGTVLEMERRDVVVGKKSVM